jgi:Zn-dependent protease
VAKLPEFLLMYLVFVFSTTFHEFAHAWVAHRGGDDTAYVGGHVTLDPTPHIRRSPLGMVLIPIFSYLQAGWMIGWASVPFDPVWGSRHPLRQALMSLAGPAANFILAALALVALRLLIDAGVYLPTGGRYLIGLPEGVSWSSPWAALGFALANLFKLNVVLGLFNLIPLPPLDGAGVAEGVFPRQLGALYGRLREVPMIEILGVLAASALFSEYAGPLVLGAYRLLYL